MEIGKKESYKQILENRQRISEFAKDFIFIVDNNFSIQYLNNCAAKRLGCSQQDVIGKPLGGLFPPDYYEMLKQRLEMVFQSGESFLAENSIGFADKELRLDTRFAPIKENDTVAGVLVIARDVTEPKR